MEHIYLRHLLGATAVWSSRAGRMEAARLSTWFPAESASSRAALMEHFSAYQIPGRFEGICSVHSSWQIGKDLFVAGAASSLSRGDWRRACVEGLASAGSAFHLVAPRAGGGLRYALGVSSLPMDEFEIGERLPPRIAAEILGPNAEVDRLKVNLLPSRCSNESLCDWRFLVERGTMPSRRSITQRLLRGGCLDASLQSSGEQVRDRRDKWLAELLATDQYGAVRTLWALDTDEMAGLSERLLRSFIPVLKDAEKWLVLSAVYAVLFLNERGTFEPNRLWIFHAAYAARKAGEIEESNGLFETALAEMPEAARGRCMFAQVLIEDCQLQRARDLLGHACIAESDEPLVLNWAADLYSSMGDCEEAARLRARVPMEEPDPDVDS